MPDWRKEIRRRLEGTRLSPAQEQDVVEELAQHLEDQHDELRAQGVPELEAVRIVLEELKENESLAESLYAVKPRRRSAVALGGGTKAGLLGGIGQDVGYALRLLRLSPGFTATAVLALGLGAGAATAVFSLLDGVVLRPLPYAAPERLVTIRDTNREEDLDQQPVSPVNAMDYHRLTGVFQDVAVWWRPEVNLVDEVGEAMRVPTVETSENLFQVLGVQAAVGRTFPVDSTLHGTEQEAVISDRLWQNRFGGDPAVVGRTVRLNGFVYTLVGVMPAGFHFPGDTDVWQQLQWDLEQHSRGAHFMEAVARLQPGVTLEQANRDLAALGTRLAKEFPETNAGWTASALPLHADIAGVFRPGLYALFGASGLLLLIACINVASLLLARASARQAEVAVRSALGASRIRLIRQFLAESLVLAALGTAVGFAVAVAAVRGFLAWSPIAIPRVEEVGINGLVLAFTVGVAVVTALVFGVVPALLGSRTNLQETLRDSGRGLSGQRAGSRLRGALVVAEVALAVTLLTGAGYLIRSVAALMDEETGVMAAGAITVDLQLPDADYDWARVEQFYSSLLPALREHPQLTSAGASNFLPLEAGWRIPYALPGAPTARRGEEAMAQYHSVDEGYFQALGAALLGGRNFEPRDDANAPGVVIVNETFARQVWPGEDPVGKRIQAMARVIGPLGYRLVKQNEHEVIGVVADVKNTSLTSEPEPAIYSNARQFPFRKMYLVIRGSGDASLLSSIVRTEVQRVDPTLPLGEVRTLERILAASSDPPRFVMLLMSVFAGLALLLAAIGIYGVLSYMVHYRKREIGIRLALGARPRDVLRLMVVQGLALAVAGVCLGVMAALVGSRFLSGLLYEVKPTDPATLGSVVAVVLAVALVACLAPGRRAALTDPMRTLRGD